MKTIVKEKETKKIEFPCLMKSEKGLVVLFQMRNKGIVLKGNDDWDRGYFGTNWSMECFTPFEGEIILSND